MPMPVAEPRDVLARDLLAHKNPNKDVYRSGSTADPCYVVACPHH